MKKLINILKNITVVKTHGGIDVLINEIHFDSRNIKQNDIFVAQKGYSVDGHNFIKKAVEDGASVVVFDDKSFDNYNDEVVYIQVENSNTALAIMASNYFENPSSKLDLIGITGTNGKTTIATLLFNLFKKLGYKVGLLSTVIIQIDNEQIEATHTTPDSLTINKLLDKMVMQGVEYCFMEVSSHGIHQGRTSGLQFKGGVFTNLTHDHLDYHKTFAEYRDVKKQFFDELSKDAFALVNVDDKNGSVMLQNTKANKLSYALKTSADYKSRIIENQLSGLLLQINNTEVWSKLIGSFNAYNLTAIYGVALELGLDKIETLRVISELNSVSGRFQHTISDFGITAIVDYAHTPDALKNVLETINDVKVHGDKVITIVGCGGDRDKTKRPKMGFIATQLSNQVIFTSDNPRSEDADVIIEEMEKGVAKENENKYLSITNRRQAIKTACKLAKKGDIILIAGKGHETYQIIKGVKSDFDDYKIVTDLLK
ncbi:MAG TPA: UDP-N-acetylmuramoyl-L-alanyl-D-glutamate--2,6-diaminopimelate ligase [Flavobacteriaceae bacterium]|nr:UDP-N-acetylmuramoyl-L-alanyl-D-glutamate--2,6-diaminopimelate ligase [Flavobacteriaceae bacterium]HIP27426.1 UDP-N-acetylmuramoyl-L-alanyl-D-glutamate--2,6-diaminopimelate ligase [Flavobacteriaceae bacterium]